MDQMKIGKFLAELRRENNMTQELLGRKIGVTNKTISRWENGNYMPDVEMLLLMSGIFKVSVNELLCGRRLGDESFREEADQNLVQIWKNAGFSVKERMGFWKKKWRREHAALFIVCTASAAAVFLWAFLIPVPWLVGLCPLGFAVLCGVLNNRMMIYVENKVFPAREDRPPVSPRKTCGR